MNAHHSDSQPQPITGDTAKAPAANAMLGASQPPPQPPPQPGAAVAQEQQQQQQQPRPAKPRPTHFVSLRVSHSPEVVECMQRVQQQLVSACPDLQPCLLEPVTAHMTILVLNMHTQEHEGVAASVMSSLPAALQQQGLGQLSITLQGLSTFRDQVLYLDVAPGPALTQLQLLGDAVISHFRATGSEVVVEEPGRGFTPHVTVAKTSRLLGGHHHKRKRGKGGSSKIPSEAWSELADVAAGQVLLAELQICSMQGRKAGQFYRVTHSIQLPAATNSPSRKRAAERDALSGARRRFKRLVDALVCRKNAELQEVDTQTREQE